MNSVFPLFFVVWFFGLQASFALVDIAPKPAKVPHVHRIHGHERKDNYHWMKDETRTNKEVLAHLKAENKFADAFFADTKPLQEKLFKEMVGRVNEMDMDVPYLDRGYFYYSKEQKGKNHPIYYRKKDVPNSKEVVLLDLNLLEKKSKNVSLGAMQVSPDQKWLAYSLDEKGIEKFTIYFKEIDAGKVLQETIPDTDENFVWAEDNKHVFFAKMNKAFRRDRIFRYERGKPQSIQLVYTEKDELFDVSVRKTQDSKYLILDSVSYTSGEEQYLDAKNPTGGWKMIQPRVPNMKYQVEHRDGFFYILNDEKALDFKISRTPVSSPHLTSWKDFIKHEPASLFTTGIHMQKNRMIYQRLKNGLNTLQYYDFTNESAGEIPFDQPVYTVFLEDNPMYDTNVVRLSFQSPITPEIIYDYDFTSQRLIKLKQKEYPGYNPNLYETQKLMVRAWDGEEIPVVLLSKKNFKKDGSAPLLLYAYGSYGYTNYSYFNANIFNLVDRGFMYADANLRGSQAKGKIWYEKGKLGFKQNTFNDYIDVAKYLIKNKYTSSNKLVAEGRSAGGLLMGAVMNQAPELFRAVLAGVPFVDVLSTVLDSNLRFSTQEYEQWGNPNKKADYDYILTYSPYDNVGAKKYPALLAVAGLHDSRVNYWEPAKWVALLRDSDQGSEVKLLRTNMDAGHSGNSGRYDSFREEAEEQAFMLKSVGIAQ